MDPDLDEAVTKWDRCKKTAHYDAWDWKQEVQLLSEQQRANLFVSPLGAEHEKEGEEESDGAEIDEGAQPNLDSDIE